jgi:enoyl-CoA hydratase/carnithine racemase
VKVDTNILFESRDGVAVVTLNRPRVLNALSAALKQELSGVFDRVATDPSIRAMVLTGGGKAFSAGQDLNEAKDLDGAGAEEWVREYARLYRKMRAVPVPVIAAVSGWAVGAGLQLALLSDIRICSPTAKFAMPEIKDGIPAIFGLALLAPVIGMSRSLEMVLTGEPLNARDALKAGMVSRVYPQARLPREAKALAKKLGSCAPLATRLDKEFARQLSDKDFEAAVEFAIAAHHQSFEAGDARKGMEAFFAR